MTQNHLLASVDRYSYGVFLYRGPGASRATSHRMLPGMLRYQCFPLGDLVRVDHKCLRQLGGGSISLKDRQHHFRLEHRLWWRLIRWLMISSCEWREDVLKQINVSTEDGDKLSRATYRFKPHDLEWFNLRAWSCRGDRFQFRLKRSFPQKIRHDSRTRPEWEPTPLQTLFHASLLH